MTKLCSLTMILAVFTPIISEDLDEKEAIIQFCRHPTVKASLPILTSNHYTNFSIYVFNNQFVYQLNLTSKVISNVNLIRNRWNYKGLIVLADDIDSAFSTTVKTSDSHYRSIDHFIKGGHYWSFMRDDTEAIAYGYTSDPKWSLGFPQTVNGAFHLIYYTPPCTSGVYCEPSHQNEILLMSKSSYYIYGPYNKTNTGELVITADAYVDKDTSELLFLLPENRYRYLGRKDNYILVNQFMNITAIAERYGSPYLIIFAYDHHCFVNYANLLDYQNVLPPNVKCNKTKNQQLIINTPQCKYIFEEKKHEVPFPLIIGFIIGIVIFLIVFLVIISMIRKLGSCGISVLRRSKPNRY